MRKYVFLRLSSVFILGAVSVCSAMEDSPPDVKTEYKQGKKRNSSALSEQRMLSLDSNPELKDLARMLDFTSEENFFPKTLRRRLSGLRPQPPQRNLSGESSVPVLALEVDSLSSVRADLKDLSLSPKK